MVRYLINSQGEDIAKFNNDFLSNKFPVHLTSTFNQSSLFERREACKYRITASSFATLKTCPLSCGLWKKTRQGCLQSNGAYKVRKMP